MDDDRRPLLRRYRTRRYGPRHEQYRLNPRNPVGLVLICGIVGGLVLLAIAALRGGGA